MVIQYEFDVTETLNFKNMSTVKKEFPSNFNFT